MSLSFILKNITLLNKNARVIKNESQFSKNTLNIFQIMDLEAEHFARPLKCKLLHFRFFIFFESRMILMIVALLVFLMSYT